MASENTPKHIEIDERNHVEKPLLEQLDGSGWDIIDVPDKQLPADTGRDRFTQVILPQVPRGQLKITYSTGNSVAHSGVHP